MTKPAQSGVVTPLGGRHPVSNQCPLSTRQAMVLELLAADLIDEVIARKLRVTSRTIRKEVAALYLHFGVQSRFSLGIAYSQWRRPTAYDSARVRM
ncbi:LuxR C-terminal-related transcriptional regulator [Luteipulveratus mongoliensis]|uniref:HTH luxR-type domain-containing protein n=1 Tax=Luteipulveratus mongoliensis TaxID=571913 RepID=A0A0K1JEH9_9MICO|nr:LuxR C-terminal-related transcriptional regulator [Luteipulveratus mongoliensis]AKU15003.1 hypothetical protein VV02_02550 [Luteipulveratus mongoliensis]